MKSVLCLIVLLFAACRFPNQSFLVTDAGISEPTGGEAAIVFPDAALAPDGSPSIDATSNIPGELRSIGTMRIMSFNVRGSTLCAQGAGAVNLQATVNHLLSNAVDVLFLQESDCDNGVLAQAWQNGLRLTDSSARVRYLRSQVAILTRLPVLNAPMRPAESANVSIALEVSDDFFQYVAESGSRRMIRNVVVDYRGQHARLIGIHPTAGGCGQVETNVRDYVGRYNDLPVIMVGDYNCSTRSFTNNPAFWSVQNFSLTCNSPGYMTDQSCGPTTKPLGKLQLWFQDDMGPIDHIGCMKAEVGGVRLAPPHNTNVIRTLPMSFSDHNPIQADVELISRN